MPWRRSVSSLIPALLLLFPAGAALAGECVVLLHGLWRTDVRRGILVRRAQGSGIRTQPGVRAPRPGAGDVGQGCGLNRFGFRYSEKAGGPLRGRLSFACQPAVRGERLRLLQQRPADALAAGHALIEMLVPIGRPGDQNLARAFKHAKAPLTGYQISRERRGSDRPEPEAVRATEDEPALHPEIAVFDFHDLDRAGGIDRRLAGAR